MAQQMESNMTTVNIGKSIDLDVDFASMPQAAIDHILYIGARNVLMDSHASITKESNPNDLVAAATAMAQKKLDALMRGEVRVQSTREGDPVRAEAIRMATAQITAIIKKAGKKVSDYKPADIRAKAVERVTPELLAMAAERVAQLKTVATPESLADLGL
jgi:hypothetical protein